MGKIFRWWVPASYPLKTPGNDGLPTGTRSLALTKNLQISLHCYTSFYDVLLNVSHSPYVKISSISIPLTPKPAILRWRIFVSHKRTDLYNSMKARPLRSLSFRHTDQTGKTCLGNYALLVAAPERVYPTSSDTRLHIVYLELHSSKSMCACGV